MTTGKISEIAAAFSETLKQKGNEKSYINILKITRGCKICVHHTLDDKLHIDLRATKAAKRDYGETIKETVRKFDEFFKKNDLEIIELKFVSLLGNDVRDEWYVDVTDCLTITIIDKLKGLIKYLSNEQPSPPPPK